MTLVPITELEAVNVALSSAGEERVSSLDGDGLSDVDLAHQTLLEELRGLQKRGWSFNTNYAQEFPLTAASEIVIPANSTRFDIVRSDGRRGMQRGSRLWNQDTNSWKWDAPVKADVVLLLPFEELPESARWLVTIRAARRYQRSVLGSDTIERFNAEAEYKAYVEFLEDERSREDANIFDAPDTALYLNRTADVDIVGMR